MKTSTKLIVSLAATAVFAVLLGVTSLLGRAVLGGPLAVIQRSNAIEPIVEYSLVDIDRGLLAYKTLAVPDMVGVDFDYAPALVLQADRTRNSVDWTLSELDPLAGTLTARVVMTTSPSSRLATDDFQQADDTSWRIYSTVTGETYYAAPGSPTAQMVTIRGMNLPWEQLSWSWDGTQVATVVASGIAVADAGGENGRTIAISDTDAAFGGPNWSPDGRYIATSWDMLVAEAHAAVVDVETGKIVTRLPAAHVSWCGGRLLYVNVNADGLHEARLFDPLTGVEQPVVSRDMSAFSALPNRFTIHGIDAPACEWFLLWAAGTGYTLYHLPTERLILLGLDGEFQEIEFTDGLVTAWALVNGATELRRVALDSAADAYDVLWRMNAPATSVRSLPDGRGWLALRADATLVLIDAAGAETALTGRIVRAFYVVE